MSSSNPTASAQAMSHWPSSVCHPGWSHQARQCGPMIILIPTPELASEKAATSMNVGGGQMGLWRESEERVFDHQLRSKAMVFSGLWGIKGFQAHTGPSMCSKPVRYARPARIRHEACNSLLLYVFENV